MKKLKYIWLIFGVVVLTMTNCEKKEVVNKDCNGVEDGSAYLDECEECVGGTTGKESCILDCNGIAGGTAYLDDCKKCVGGTTGKEPCTKDCNESFGGTAYLDECDECVGGTTGKEPCLNDTRDGKKYKIVKIGTQTWMAENLNYTTSNSWCYDDNVANCTKYGRLYTWHDALTACPSGWHLPDDVEWTTLSNYLGGISIAGGKMKSTTDDWASPNTGATNSSGFSGLPGGYRKFDNGVFYSIGIYGNWWSRTQNIYNRTHGNVKYLYRNNDNLEGGSSLKSNGASCRCVRD